MQQLDSLRVETPAHMAHPTSISNGNGYPMSNDPYEPPETASDSPSGHDRSTVANPVGDILLWAGMLALTYGAVACFLINLPPNNPVSGRLPSIYIMAAGSVLSLVGLTMRNSLQSSSSAKGTKRVSPLIGILFLLAIMIAVVVAIARL
jgi:hypothetical protein